MACALVLGIFGIHVAAAPANPAEYMRLMREGLDQLRAGSYEKAIETFKEVEKLSPEGATAAYNIACCYSLMGKKDQAIAYLRKAVSLGFTDLRHVEADTDLDGIRNEGGYREVLAELKRKAEERDAELRKEGRQAARKALEKKETLFPFEFELKDIEGERLRLADFAGKVVLVDLWGTWCGPCRRAIPDLIQLQKEYGKKGLAVVGLAFEHETGEAALEKVKEVVKKEGINYPCALIDQEFLKGIPGFRGFPTVILLDRSGKVRLLRVGYSEHGSLAGWVEEFLSLPAGKPKRRWF